MGKDISVVFKGFKTPEQAQAFVDWYEGQGEQDACVWFECRDNLDGVTMMPVASQATSDNTTTVTLEMLT